MHFKIKIMSWSAIILCPHDDGGILQISCGHKNIKIKKNHT